jgi:transposase
MPDEDPRLTDDQWQLVLPLIPEAKRRSDGRGRPWKDHRAVLDGILYVLRTGSAWARLPRCYPPYQTCHRRFQQWLQQGVINNVLTALNSPPRSTGPVRNLLTGNGHSSPRKR